MSDALTLDKGAAQARGAMCTQCPLRDAPGPIFGEHNNSDVTILVTGPAERELEEHRPLVGPAGMEVQRALDFCGKDRKDVNLHTIVLCQPKGNDLKKLTARIDRRRATLRRQYNKGREEDIPAKDWPLYPQECCAPRLERDLQGSPFVISMGDHASKVVAGESIAKKRKGSEQVGILAYRGTLMEREPVKDMGIAFPGVRRVLPTVQPSYVMRQPRWREAFYRDVARGFRWFKDQLEWVEPEIIYAHTSEAENQIRAWFRATRSAKFYAYDVETAPYEFMGKIAFDPLRADLRCVGIGALVGDRATALVIPFQTVNGWPVGSDAQRARVKALIRAWLLDPNVNKVGHNAGYYDRIVCEQYFGVTPVNVTDTILLHKVVQPELPHTLGYVGSFYTDVHAWKAGHVATHAQTDEQLWHYNALDCVVNARVAPPLARGMVDRRQQAVFAVDTAMQDVCCRLHRNGMAVSETVRQQSDIELRGLITRWRDDCRAKLANAGVNEQSIVRSAKLYDPREEEAAQEEVAALGLPVNEHNPASYPQVARVLFGLWDMPVPEDLSAKDVYTGAGLRSTGNAVLLSLLCDRRTTPEQFAYIHAVRRFRKFAKIFGTYVHNMRPEVVGGRVWTVDDRVHADWNAHGTSVGRLSSSGPNMQNWNTYAKRIIVAKEGRTHVSADEDQLHLRIIGARWKVASLLTCFTEGLDPHGVFAENIFGDAFRKAKGYQGYGVKPIEKINGKPTPASDMRDIAKRLRYAGAYGASVPTIFRELLGSEDENGVLTNPNLRPKQVSAMYDAWMEAEPEWAIAWEQEMDTWKRQGYALSPILGRRREFLNATAKDMDKFIHDVVNGPILCAEGDIMGPITVDCMHALDEWNKRHGRGDSASMMDPNDAIASGAAILVNQCHDSVSVECNDADAPEIKLLIEDVMTRTIPGWGVPFTAKGKIDPCWGNT